MRVDKTACDICGTEHRTGKQASPDSSGPGEWLQLRIEVASSYDPRDIDRASSSVDVCVRDSCITAGWSKLIETAGADLVASIKKTRESREARAYSAEAKR